MKKLYEKLPTLLKEVKAVVFYPSSLEYGYSRLRRALRWGGVKAFSSVGEGRIYIWTEEYSKTQRMTEELRERMEKEALHVYQVEQQELPSEDDVQKAIQRILPS